MTITNELEVAAEGKRFERAGRPAQRGARGVSEGIRRRVWEGAWVCAVAGDLGFLVIYPILTLLVAR